MEWKNHDDSADGTDTVHITGNHNTRGLRMVRERDADNLEGTVNQPVALMTEQDVRRYRFLIEAPHRTWFEDDMWCIEDLVESDFDTIKGYGDTAEDAIDDLMRQLKWEPKS